MVLSNSTLMEPPRVTPGRQDLEWFSETTRETFFSSPWASLGHTTNNVAELWGLTRGLQLAIEHNFTKLIVEGDSQIILNLFRKILNGTDPERISPCWRLSHGLRTIVNLIRPNQAFIPSHVRRKVNQIADELANIGMNWEGPELLCQTSINPTHPILQHCKDKAKAIDNSPDGVPVRDKCHQERA
jgi:ribonuclease HI